MSENMENLTLLPPEELPVTDEAKKRRETPNCLGMILREFLDEFGLTDAQVVKETGLAWTTYFEWVTEAVDCQWTDGNLFKLWQFVNKYKPMSLQYLVYGVGEDGGENGNEESA